MEVEWTRPAYTDLIEAQLEIAKEDPQASQRIAQCIWDASQALGDNPKIGKAGYIKGTRIWVVQKTSFLLMYQIQNNQVEILHLYHGRQNWQAKETD